MSSASLIFNHRCARCTINSHPVRCCISRGVAIIVNFGAIYNNISLVFLEIFYTVIEIFLLPIFIYTAVKEIYKYTWLYIAGPIINDLLILYPHVVEIPNFSLIRYCRTSGLSERNKHTLYLILVSGVTGSNNCLIYVNKLKTYTWKNEMPLSFK